MQAETKLKRYAVELLAQVPGETKEVDPREFQFSRKQLFIYKGATTYRNQFIPYAAVITTIGNGQYRINLAQLYYNHLHTFNNCDFWKKAQNTEVPMDFYHEIFGTNSLTEAENLIGGHLVNYDQDKYHTYLDYAEPMLAEFLHYLEHGIKPKIVDTYANVEVLTDLNSASVQKAEQSGPAFIIDNDPGDTLMPVFIKTIQMYAKIAAEQAAITESELNADKFADQLLKGNYIRETVSRYQDTLQAAVEFTLNVNRGFNVTAFTPEGKIAQTQNDTLSGSVFRLNQELQKINFAAPDQLGIFKLKDLLQ